MFFILMFIPKEEQDSRIFFLANPDFPHKSVWMFFEEMERHLENSLGIVPCLLLAWGTFPWIQELHLLSQIASYTSPS